jgi:hypothetical protein
MRDLPPTGGAPCSNAYVVNTRGQAVGNDTDGHGHSLAAVLREHGPAYDLNRLIGRSPLRLAEAFYINNQGEIGCLATLPNGDMHMALLVPAGLTARQGLPGTPATRPASTISTSCPAQHPDPRDQFASIRQRLAAGTRLQFPW